jgi:prepilin-type N-terminal cleavage/methylation domain-containing protein
MSEQNSTDINRLKPSSRRKRKVKLVSMKIKTSRKAGFTLVEIMIVVAIIGLLAAIAIPNFVKARTTSQKNACINNLRQIDGAMQQWALENNASASATVGSTEVTPYLGRGGGQFPTCPSGGAYTVTDVATPPTCDAAGGEHVLPSS